MHFRKADQLFADHELWKSVPERDRRELYDDIVHQLEKKEKALTFIFYVHLLIILSDVIVYVFLTKMLPLIFPISPAVVG